MKLRTLSAARLSFPLASALAAMLTAPSAHAGATLYWDGAGTWTAAAQWGTVSGGPYASTWAAGDDAVFNVASSTITGAITSFNSITANENVTVASGGTLSSSGTTANITVAAGKSLTFGSQALSGGIIKLGDGELSLSSSSNNFGSGGFTLNAGTVTVGGTNALGTSAALTINGGNLRSNGSRDMSGKVTALTIGGDFSTGAVGFTGAFTFNAATALGGAARTMTLNDNLILNGIVSGVGGGITKEGVATLTLGNAANDYTGATTINDGTLSLTGSLTGGGNVSTSGAGILTQGTSSVISGASNIAQGSSGISTLAGNNTYTGTTTATAGVLLATKALVLSGYATTGKVNFDGGTIAARVGNSTVGWTTDEVDTLLLEANKNSGALGIDTTVVVGGNLTQWVAFTDDNFGSFLGLTKLGTGNLTLNQNNNYAGNTTVIAGTLSVTGALSGGGAVLVTGGNFSLSGSLTGDSAVSTSGTGNFTQSGAGVLSGATSFTQGSSTTNTLSLANSHTGGTSVTAGTLSLTGNLTGGGAVSTSGTGILTQAASSVISGNSSFTQGSSGTSTLSGVNSYSGNTNINAGTLVTPLATNLSGYNVAGKVVFGGGMLVTKIGDGSSTGWSTAQVDTLLGNATKTSGVLGIDTTNGNLIQGPGFTMNLGALGLTKLGTNTLTLDQANSYTGPTTIAAGGITINSIGSVNGGNSSLGAPTNATNGTIAIGSGTTAAQLTYTGTAQTTDRVINLAGTTGGAILDQSGTGALKFTSALTATGAGAKTLTLQGSTAGTGEIAGAIVDSTAATAVTKAGTGTWTLSGNNTHTGTTTLGGGGSVVLDYDTNDNNKIAGSLTLGGGTMILKGGATKLHLEDVTSTFVNVGGTFISRSGANSVKLNMNGLSRAIGGTISFADGTIANTDLNNTGTSGVNGILGGWATVGSHWAVSVNTGAADTAVTALSSYTSLLTSGGVQTTNYQVTGNQTQAGTTLAGSLRIANNANSQTLELGNNNLTILSSSTTAAGTGGILYAGGNDNNYTISNGATGTGRIISSTTNRELIFHAHTGTLTVEAFVGLSGSTGSVTKSGAGTLVLEAVNNYTGATFVNEGTLRLTNSAGAGTTAGGILVQNNAALELADGVAVGAENLTITGSGIANAGALRSVANTTASYAGAITIGSGGARINSDAGALTLSNTITTAVLSNVTFGGLGNTTVTSAGVISGAGGLVKDGAGTTTLAATNTYTGGTTITGGTLSVGAAANLGDAAANLVFDGGTLQVTGTGLTSLTGLGRTNAVVFNAGKTVGLDIASASNTFTVGQALNQTTGGFIKSGAGTVILDQTNTYTGNTTVNGGRLAINGSVSTGLVTVNAGGTLGGNGSIAGSVSVQTGGTVGAGNSIESLVVGGNYTSGNGTTFAYELDKSVAPGVAGDLTVVGGDLTFTGTVTLTLTELVLPGTWDLGTPLGSVAGGADKLTLIAYFGTWNGGLFTYAGNLVQDDSAIMLNGQQWWFNYNDTTAGSNYTGDVGNSTSFVTMTVPEPNVAALLGGLGTLALLRRRR